MSGKLTVLCLVVCGVACMIASCSRDSVVDPNGTETVTDRGDIMPAGHPIDADERIQAQTVIIALYDDYGRLIHIERTRGDYELARCLSSAQIRDLNEERYVSVTGTDESIGFALNMGIDLSPDRIAHITEIKLLDGSWGCAKKCFLHEDPNAVAQCLKNCEDKDPNKE
jgi:hypothetical protein